MVPKALPHQKHKRSDTSLSQWSHSHTVFLLPSTSFSLLFRDADFICFSAASSRSLLWWVTFPASRCSCLLPYTEWSQLFSQQLKSFWNTLSKGCFQCYHSLLPKGNFQSRGNHLNILPLRFLLPTHQPHTTLLTRSACFPPVLWNLPWNQHSGPPRAPRPACSTQDAAVTWICILDLPTHTGRKWMIAVTSCS